MAEGDRLERLERLMELSIVEAAKDREVAAKDREEAAKDRVEAAKDRVEAAKDRKDIKGIQRELAANLKQMGKSLLRIEVGVRESVTVAHHSAHLLEGLLRLFKSQRNGGHGNGRTNGGRRRK